MFRNVKLLPNSTDNPFTSRPEGVLHMLSAYIFLESHPNAIPPDHTLTFDLIDFQKGRFFSRKSTILSPSPNISCKKITSRCFTLMILFRGRFLRGLANP